MNGNLTLSYAVRKYWRMSLALWLICVGAATAVTIVTPPRYSASSQLFVSIGGADSVSDLSTGALYSQTIVQTYAQLGTSGLVLGKVAGREKGRTAADLAKSVTVEAPTDTTLINITATGSTPIEAANVANSVAQDLSSTITKITTTEGRAVPVQLTQSEVATPPSRSSQPNVGLNLSIGALIGVLLLLILSGLRLRLTDSLEEDDDVAEVTRSPIIGRIRSRSTPEVGSTRGVAAPSRHSSEEYQYVVTNLRYLMSDISGGATVLLTSSVASEGKTVSAAQLGASIAAADKRVLVLDADLRRPAVGTYLGLDSEIGLCNLLLGTHSLSEVAQPWGTSNYMYVVPAGQPLPPNPSVQLGSAGMRQVLKEAKDAYDFVIVDSPPVLPVPDALAVAQVVDVVILVCRAHKLRRRQLVEAMGRLANVGVKPGGVIRTFVANKSSTYNYYAGGEHTDR